MPSKEPKVADKKSAPKRSHHAKPAPHAPVIVDNRTRRSDDDAMLGSWVDIVAGEHQGRFGHYYDTASTDAATGYPGEVLVRTRDARNEILQVLYSQVRPSERTGGR